jgi:predicted RNase H-like HicB family nuclease
MAADSRESFTVVVHEEDGGFWGEVPELPGCASQGTTLDELFVNIIDAIEGCLAVQLEDEGPHPRGKVFTMNVPVSVPHKAVPA